MFSKFAEVLDPVRRPRCGIFEAAQGCEMLDRVLQVGLPCLYFPSNLISFIKIQHCVRRGIPISKKVETIFQRRFNATYGQFQYYVNE